jgi:hypothetical protein
LKIKFGGRKIIGKYGYERVCNNFYGALRTFMQNNPALKPNGGLLLTLPQHQFLWSTADESAQHVRRYCIVDLKEKVERAGFKVLRSTSFVSLLLPLMLASRRRHSPPGIEQAKAELALSKPIDTLMENVMRMELGFIRAGLNFPIGGSLLLIASKV